MPSPSNKTVEKNKPSVDQPPHSNKTSSPSASHIDLARPPEMRTPPESQDTTHLNIMRRAFESQEISDTQEKHRTPQEIYVSSIEEVQTTLATFEKFLDEHHTGFQSTERDLMAAFLSDEPDMAQKFQEHLTTLQDYRSEAEARRNTTNDAIRKMKHSQSAYHQETHTDPEEKIQLDHRYDEAIGKVRNFAFKDYRAQLDKYIQMLETYTKLVEACQKASQGNQIIAERLGPRIDPDQQRSNEEETLRKSVQQFNEKYAIPTQTIPFAITMNDHKENVRMHESRIAMLEDKCKELKRQRTEQATEIDQDFSEQIQTLQQLHKTQKERNPLLFVKRYDQSYPDIKKQAKRLAQLRRATRFAKNISDIPSAPWHNTNRHAIIFSGKILQERATNLTNEFQEYRKSRRSANEIQRILTEKVQSKKNLPGTIDGYLGWHQAKKGGVRTHHENLFDSIGDNTCGITATFITEEIFGADLNNSGVVNNILQRFPDDTTQGLKAFEVRDALNNSSTMPITFKHMIIYMTNYADEMIHFNGLTIPLGQISTLLHQRIHTNNGNEIYAPILVGIEREKNPDEHWCVIQAIKETDKIRYYSNEKIVTTDLINILELVKDTKQVRSLIVFNGYKDDPSASMQSGKEYEICNLHPDD